MPKGTSNQAHIALEVVELHLFKDTKKFYKYDLKFSI